MDLKFKIYQVGKRVFYTALEWNSTWLQAPILMIGKLNLVTLKVSVSLQFQS